MFDAHDFRIESLDEIQLELRLGEANNRAAPGIFYPFTEYRQRAERSN
jgi:hypothetical protein